MMRSGNPALKESTFRSMPRAMGVGQTMTLQGTVNKTFFLLLLALMGASITWMQFFEAGGATSMVQGLTGLGLFGGLIMALVTSFKREWAGITAPLYAGLEGLFLGGISAIFEMRFPGLVMQAVGLTFGVAFSLLFAYRSGLIKVTENFKLGVVAATGGIFLIYMVTWIMSFFGSGIPYIHESGLIGIGFSLLVVVIASLNLVLDFDFIENGSEMGLPKYMEWYGAFGLVVTLVWLYLEMLRLLSKLQSRN